MENKKFFFAVATLVSTIIGAGIFALPYAFARAGFWPSLLVFGILAAVSIIIMLMYGEVILRTEGIQHESTGYAGTYLGKMGRRIMLATNLLSVYGGLLIYIIAGGDFLRAVFGPEASLSPLIWGIIFFGIVSCFVIMGMHFVSKADLVFLVLFVVLVTILLVLAVPKISVANFSTSDFSQILFPFGVIIFSLSGSAAIALINNILKGQARSLKSAIVWGGAIAAVISLVFTVAVLGLGGAEVASDSVETVRQFLPPLSSLALAIFGLLAVGTTFFIFGLIMRNMYMFDFKIKRGWAVLLTLIFPIVLFCLGVNDFVSTISFVGSVTGGLTGIMYVLMYRRAQSTGKRSPEYSIDFPIWVQGIILFIYVLAIAYEIVRLF